MMQELTAFVAYLFRLPEVAVIAAGVFLNTLLAVALAVRNQEFRLGELANFLARDLFPYVLVYAGFRLAGDALGMSWVATAVWGVITASLLGRIAEKLREFGIQRPTE